MRAETSSRHGYCLWNWHMTARSHTALRIAAIAWIAAMVLVPPSVWSAIPEAFRGAVSASNEHASAVPVGHGLPVARR